jgi:phosphopantothenoylcysteine decarboxylase/phosphopantothenate--cysteine ligase
VALIALGVTGSIGAYKSVEVCRGLQKRGHDVVAVMTRAATRFVGPVTFEAITRRRVITSQWKPGANADIEHVAIADGIDLLLIAPCTANVIGKCAHGIADDFLTSLYLATKAPVMMAPAMNTNMLAHEAVQANLRMLAARGVRFVEAGEGYLACGWIGRGRLAEPEEIVAAADGILRGRADSVLRHRRVVVSAGPTYEDIDPVRYVGNRSSGRMGYALAEAARRRGAHVTLVTGPTSVEPPHADAMLRVRSAKEMHAAVMSAAAGADVVIMAAAVADYAPVQVADEKIAKTDAPLSLALQRTPDILADLGRGRQGGESPMLVGFAAETRDLLARAREKRLRKNVDIIVANDVSSPGSGFDAATNAVIIVDGDGEHAVPLQSKGGVAEAILDRVETLLRKRAPSTARV